MGFTIYVRFGGKFSVESAGICKPRKVEARLEASEDVLSVSQTISDRFGFG